MNFHNKTKNDVERVSLEFYDFFNMSFYEDLASGHYDNAHVDESSKVAADVMTVYWKDKSDTKCLLVRQIAAVHRGIPFDKELRIFLIPNMEEIESEWRDFLLKEINDQELLDILKEKIKNIPEEYLLSSSDKAIKDIVE